MSDTKDRLNNFIADAKEFTREFEISRWQRQISSYLLHSFGKEVKALLIQSVLMRWHFRSVF